MTRGIPQENAIILQNGNNLKNRKMLKVRWGFSYMHHTHK